MAAGDVLFVRGFGRSLGIGANGGLFGHVMVAVSDMDILEKDSVEARRLAEIWPTSCLQLWRVSVIESTRAHRGLCKSQILMRTEAGTGRLLLVAEEVRGELFSVECMPVEIWQSPAQFRGLRPSLMAAVVADMEASQADWSLSTAARAMLKSALPGQRPEVLEEVTVSWAAAPICTSIVISFWQRYLCRYARVTNAAEMELILRCMPLKADQVLPQELLHSMSECGWTRAGGFRALTAL